MNKIKLFFQPIRNRLILGLLIISLAINILMWIFWFTKIKAEFDGVYFATGIIILNLFLGLYFYKIQPFASYILLSTTLLVQFLILIYMRFLLMALI